MSKIFLFLFFGFSSFSCWDKPLPEENNLVVWSIPLIPEYVNTIQPVIDNGYTYLIGDTTMQCFELTTGKLIWQRGLEKQLPLFQLNISGKKILHEGNYLYINDSHVIWCFNKTNGEVVWKTNIAIYGTIWIPYSMMSQNSTHLFLGGKNKVIGIEKNTGTIDIELNINNREPYIQAIYDPLVIDNLLYMPTGYYTGTMVKGDVLCYDLNTKKYLWTYSTPNYKLPDNIVSQYSDGSVLTSFVYDSILVIAYGNSISALNRFTGTMMWEYRDISDGFGFSMGIEVYNGKVYVGSNKANVYALDIYTGKLYWKTQTQGSIISLFTIENGRLYFNNTSFGQINIFDINTGKIIWREFPPEFKKDRNYLYLSDLAVGEGYMVCVGTKKIYCLKIP